LLLVYTEIIRKKTSGVSEEINKKQNIQLVTGTLAALWRRADTIDIYE